MDFFLASVFNHLDADEKILAADFHTSSLKMTRLHLCRMSDESIAYTKNNSNLNNDKLCWLGNYLNIVFTTLC